MTGAIITINTDSFSEGKYVFCLLQSIGNNVDDIFICTSINIEEEFETELNTYCKKLYKYESYIDIQRWSDVLLYKISPDCYDYLLFINDSIFGPFWSLENFFKRAENSFSQLYGMTTHGEMIHNKKKYSRFVQSYCFIVKKEILMDKRFFRYLKKTLSISSYEESCEKFEFVFTEIIMSWGYQWETYIELTIDESFDSNYFESFILFDTYKLIKDGFPFLPKVIFDIDISIKLNFHRGDNVKQCLKYINENSNYNLSLIYDNLIHRKDAADLIEKLSLNYVICETKSSINFTNKSAVFVYLFYEDLFEESLNYILYVPDYLDIYISTDTECKIDKIKLYLQKLCTNKNLFFFVHNQKGRDLSALLVLYKPYIANYDFFCFVHDKKSKQMLYPTVGSNFNNQMWDCLLKNTNYIQNVIELLNKNLHIGLLVPPMVSHGMYFNVVIDAWTICYEKTIELSKILGLRTVISKEYNPPSLGSVFWCKTNALSKLFSYKWTYDDFPDEPMPIDGSISHCLERILPYVASDLGYYTGILCDEDTVCIETLNAKETVRRLMLNIDRWNGTNTATLLSTTESLKKIKNNKKKLSRKNKKKFIRKNE